MRVAAWEAWGEACHRHLHGAFAAAVWDGEVRQLFLIRDPTGERALYWHRSPNALLFASEPVQLLVVIDNFDDLVNEVLVLLLGHFNLDLISVLAHSTQLPMDITYWSPIPPGLCWTTGIYFANQRE